MDHQAYDCIWSNGEGTQALADQVQPSCSLGFSSRDKGQSIYSAKGQAWPVSCPQLPSQVRRLRAGLPRTARVLRGTDMGDKVPGD